MGILRNGFRSKMGQRLQYSNRMKNLPIMLFFELPIYPVVPILTYELF
ncbi:hypothetical protein HanRHA438_Chr11g0529761 [Helianthus annuus]|nr:hypothetical protein HanRHA438_Chr11g0529761 [Helianthus annuus]